LLGNFTAAVAEPKQGFALDNSQIWVMINAAHGYLFQGRLDQALVIYRRFAPIPERPGRPKTFRDAVRGDFREFRKAQYPGLELALVQQVVGKFARTW